MGKTALREKNIWKALEDVKDPEIPVVSLVEMGIIRQVHSNADCITITITPTFTGCPALHVMQEEIANRIYRLGAKHVEVKISHNPAWSTEWIAPSAREKMKGIGLAPPIHHKGDLLIVFEESAICPYCDSDNTQMQNSFGPTPCRMIFTCKNCNQPFEQFKPL